MKKIMFCGGGSAGHVMPNIALAKELSGGYSAEYMGTDGIEYGICRAEGLKFFMFTAPKLTRGKITANLSVPCRLKKSVNEAADILRREKPDVLFCKGGYASLPPALAAKKLKIPVITHESDLTPGLANKIISRFATVTLTSFPETAEKLKHGRYSGPPIRKQALCASRARAMEKFGLDGRPTVLVFGGGSGSKTINEALRGAVAEICKNFNVLHVCGRGNKIDAQIDGYVQFEFIPDIGAAYACADCAIARAGSNSAFELLLNSVPTLFIPLENRATRGDQVKNAEYFKKRGLCRILRERDLTPRTLKEKTDELMHDNDLKSNLSSYHLSCGNERILAEIERVALHGKTL